MQDNNNLLNEESTFPEIWAAADEIQRSAIREAIAKEAGASRSSVWRWSVGMVAPKTSFHREKACRIASRIMEVKFDPIKMWRYGSKA